MVMDGQRGASSTDGLAGRERLSRTVTLAASSPWLPISGGITTMLSPRSDVVTIASLVGENAALADENATLRLRADSRRIMAACGTSSSSAAHFPTIPADEDYAICAWVEVDLNRYPPGEPWSPQSVRVKYFLDAGR